jgi:Rrf2 family protein
MADHEALPRPYLEQLVVSLREAGLVTSTRGAHGGYQLARHPARIRMGEVITALEGPIAPMLCASDDPHLVEQSDRRGRSVDRPIARPRRGRRGPRPDHAR